MDICEGYKLQIQEYEGVKFIAIRKFYRHGSTASLKPGVPGFNLNIRQWQKLKELKRSLVKAALDNQPKVVQLGFDKFIEVKDSIIWLKRLPEDCCEEFLKRNTVPLTPPLWRKLWQYADWIDGQLSAQREMSDMYELEPGSSSDSIKGEDGAGDNADETKPALKMEDSDGAAAADEAAMSSNLQIDTEFATSTPLPLSKAVAGAIPQQDTDLQEDPVWYQFRAQAAAAENARKRKQPSFALRRLDAMKLPKLRFD